MGQLAKVEAAPPQMGLPFGVEIKPTSLAIPQTLDNEQVLALGQQLRAIENSSGWWIAEFILFAQGLRSAKDRPKGPKGRIYDEVLKLWPEYSRQTLINMASVARRVPAAIRRPELSFEHHRQVAILADEPHGGELMAHYLARASEAEMTHEDLRLAISDTRRGVRHEIAAPKAPPKRIVSAISPTEEVDEASPELEASAGAPPAEPEIMRDSHAELAARAQRALAEVRGWYASQRRRSSPENWPDERKQALTVDLQPVIDEMHEIVEIFNALTNAEQSGEFAGA